jgi:hypothetical protein
MNSCPMHRLCTCMICHSPRRRSSSRRFEPTHDPLALRGGWNASLRGASGRRIPDAARLSALDGRTSGPRDCPV